MTLQQTQPFDSDVAFQTIREELINRGSLRFIKDIVGTDPETSLYSEFNKGLEAKRRLVRYTRHDYDAKKNKSGGKSSKTCDGAENRVKIVRVIRLLLTWLEESGANGRRICRLSLTKSERAFLES